VAPARLCAVVKADGYGHGAVAAARAALRGGAATLAVATAGEAAALRAAGLDGPLLVMGALSPEELAVAAAELGYPALATVLFLIAAVLGLVIVVNALLRDRKAKPVETRGPR